MVQRALAKSAREILVPELPPLKRIDGPQAWKGPDLVADKARWQVVLSEADIADLRNAAEHFLGLGKDLEKMRVAEFPLQHFNQHLAGLRERLLHGIGFEVLSGLPDFGEAMSAVVFCGIGAHLGSARSQNAAGDVLGHVRDTGANASNPKTRIYQTAERQTFHTDSSDVVGLLCLRNARDGGDSLLVNAISIFNRMVEQRPDLVPFLFDPIATDRRGEVPPGAKPYLEIPPLSWHDGRLTVFYQRQYIDSAQRFEGALKLTDKHVEALDFFDACANDPELNMSMRLMPGDMQFVYNHTQLHDRTGFVDWTEPERKRHLLRLWLSIPGDRSLPEVFAQRYGSTEIGNRGGIVAKGQVAAAG